MITDEAQWITGVITCKYCNGTSFISGPYDGSFRTTVCANPECRHVFRDVLFGLADLNRIEPEQKVDTTLELKNEIKKLQKRITELEEQIAASQEDICGLCGQPGADKIPHPIHWPGERVPDTDLVHSDCENNECARAHSEFLNRVGEEGVRKFISNI